MTEEFKKKYIKNFKGAFHTGILEKKYTDNTRYIGRYRSDKKTKEGKGILHCGNNDVYMGDFVDSRF